MNSSIVQIIIAMISSNFIQFIFNRIDYVKKIESKLKYIDQGNVRTQLLILIADYPDRIDEIMKLAEQYFCKFHGNYYLTSLFKKYLDDKKLIYPNWFNANKD